MLFQLGGDSMKKILVVFTIIVPILFFNVKTSLAITITSEAVINNDGTVDIEQVWIYDDNAQVLSNTEHKISIDALYGSNHTDKESISHYEIYRNDKKMELRDRWSENLSFESKAGKYGVNKLTGAQLEIAFGITEYTTNEYVIKYKLHNAIKETSDGYKYLHWTFLPQEISPWPKEMYAEVITEDGVEIEKVYGFKYAGKVGYVDEKRDRVYAEWDEKNYATYTAINVFTLLNDEYDVIENTKLVNMTLEKKAKKMLILSNYHLEHFNREHLGPIASSPEPLWKRAWDSLAFIFIPIIVALFILTYLSQRYSLSARLVRSMSEEDKVKINKDKSFYYRDKPDEIIYSVALVRAIMKEKQMNNNIVSYYISRWVTEGVFEQIHSDRRHVDISKKDTVMSFRLHKDKLNVNSDFEEALFTEFSKIVDGDNLVTTRKLKILNMGIVAILLRRYDRISHDKLEEMGYIKTIGWANLPVLTDKGKELMFQHAGLKNFLSQLTLMEERSTSEIELWDYYFHMAALYGVSEKFKGDLSNIRDISRKQI